MAAVAFSSSSSSSSFVAASPPRSALTPSSLILHYPLQKKQSRLFFIHDPSRRSVPVSIRAMDVSEPGSIQSTLIDSMAAKIKEQLNTNEVFVQDASGDGRHVSIEVISSEFEGKTSVNRQRMVYKAIWEELQNTVHAVDSMRTLTPEEAAQEKMKESS